MRPDDEIRSYFDINLDILWKTVHEDLPALIAALEPMFRKRPE